MINAAHVGVGIEGLEGAQAARSADYAIGQFRFLKNLLFCHGREIYRRNSYAIGYMFYKNFLLVVPVWYYGVYSMFSGTELYDLILANTYNILYTAIPIIWFAAFDKEYERSLLLSRPRLYHIGLDDQYFNFLMFMRWLFYGTW